MALCPEAPDGRVFVQIRGGGGRAREQFILLREGSPFLRVVKPQGSLWPRTAMVTWGGRSVHVFRYPRALGSWCWASRKCTHTCGMGSWCWASRTCVGTHTRGMGSWCWASHTHMHVYTWDKKLALGLAHTRGMRSWCWPRTHTHWAGSWRWASRMHTCGIGSWRWASRTCAHTCTHSPPPPQRPGPAAGEVATANADVAPAPEGHRPRLRAQWLLQGPGRHLELEGEPAPSPPQAVGPLTPVRV